MRFIAIKQKRSHKSQHLPCIVHRQVIAKWGKGFRYCVSTLLACELVSCITTRLFSLTKRKETERLEKELMTVQNNLSPDL